MGIEDFKRWHWIVIAIVVGFALGYVYNGLEPANVRNVGPEQFLRLLNQRTPDGKPLVSGIRIHRAEPNFDGKPVNMVTYNKLMNRRDNKGTEIVREKFYADIPFVPSRRDAGNIDPNYTIARYLDDLEKQGTPVTYSSAWYATPGATYAMWLFGSVVAIGVLWPIVLSGLIGAGYGRPKKPEKKEDYFSRFSSHPEPETSRASRPAITQRDHDRVRELAEKIEQNLATGAGSATAAASADAAPAAPVRKLDGGPLELAPQLQPQEEDEVEIKGEYYPVLIHHKKPHDDPPAQS